MDLAKVSVLMVFAHCDDELVCGWPVLQDREIRKSLLIVSSDRHNGERTWCSHRKFATIDLCRKLDIPVRILDYDSDFYRLNARDGSLPRLERDVLKATSEFSYDAVFTHNPHGEYGHLDHKHVFEMVSRNSNVPVLITDLTMPSSWTASLPRTSRHDRLYFQDEVANVVLDAEFYRKAQKFYEVRGVWTWSNAPPQQAKIFVV